MEADNRRPPALARAEIAIGASLETVWRIHTDIDRWSEWNPKIKQVRLDGPLAVGSMFRWKSGGVSIVSVLQEVEPTRRIVWTGKAMGANARHVWDFEQREGLVIVTTSESFDGWWPRLFPGFTRRMLESILSEWLQNLKRQAEAK
jgi:uncharacterized protein YndB with AHSA1/START domain